MAGFRGWGCCIFVIVCLSSCLASAAFFFLFLFLFSMLIGSVRYGKYIVCVVAVQMGEGFWVLVCVDVQVQVGFWVVLRMD